MADGTAQKCGRVGSCHIYLNALTKSRGIFRLGEERKFVMYQLIFTDQVE